MTMDTIKIEIPSITENIRIIESFIDNAKERFNLDDDIYGNIMIAVTESVNNAIMHGNKNDRSKSVKLSLSLNDNVINFKIQDEGIGFDFQNFFSIQECLLNHIFYSVIINFHT